MNFPFEVIGHRGCEGIAPGNSIAAMQKAIELGIDRVEFDIQETLDGELTIFHDESVGDGRTKKRVAGLTRADLLRLEGKKSSEIPTIGEILTVCKGTIKIQAELKANNIESRVWSCIEETGFPVSDVNISSFAMDRLGRLQSIAPALNPVQLVFLLGKNMAVEPALDEMEALGIGSISIFAGDVTPQIVEHVHERGIRAIAWGTGDKGLQPDKIISSYQLLIYKGVDGFTCAYPDRLQGLIRGANQLT
ncbi:MAG TPA: glycerophosphodiester phosphodiesterase [Candidatus Lokiarchaeia archaeon]|nr:glycerophosphodiester phosphodiesterase [Candidatus Lokiarchaeia archaeon]